MVVLEKAKAALSKLPHRGSDGSTAEHDDQDLDESEGMPQITCYMCNQTQFFDPCSDFVQVISVRCANCLLTNLVPATSQLVRCGVCGCISDLKAPLLALLRKTSKEAGCDGNVQRSSLPGDVGGQHGAGPFNSQQRSKSQEELFDEEPEAMRSEKASGGDEISDQSEASTLGEEGQQGLSSQPPPPDALSFVEEKCSLTNPNAFAVDGIGKTSCQGRSSRREELRLATEKIALQPYLVESVKDCLPSSTGLERHL